VRNNNNLHSTMSVGSKRWQIVVDEEYEKEKDKGASQSKLKLEKQ